MDYMTEKGAGGIFVQLNFVYTLRVEVCDKEKVRFYSELFFGDDY